MGSIGNQNTLIVGCGYVGQRLAVRLRPQSRITGLVRTPNTANRLARQGITPLMLDLDLDQHRVPLSGNWPQVFYFAPPPKHGRQDTRIAHLLQTLNANEQKARLVYLGTTGVYGDCEGELVDENRPISHKADRASRRYDAEQQLRRWQLTTGNEVIFLRVAGIYGPDKLPLARLRQRKPMISAKHATWTNRIHVDDLVQVCIAAMKLGRNAEIYNVSDGQPGNMSDYFNQVADVTGLPRPPLISPNEANGRLSAGLRSYLAESRRIDNRKMLKELDIQLQYPTLAEGLAASW